VGSKSVILLDTHVVIWAAMDDARLGKVARTHIESFDRSNPFCVSAISAWEIALLVQKGRVNLGAPAKPWLIQLMNHQGWRNLPVDFDIAIESVNLPGDLHSDPSDRIIIATARLNDCTILTADRAILDYAKAGHVKALDASI
jgi:PIN domain nuclease of toxin-antitoxin system